jgi:hypothetical protein
MTMDENHGPIIKAEDILAQFAVIRTKDNRVVVHFPVDLATKEADIAVALELCGAGIQALAQIVRQQMKKQEKPRIAVVPTLPPEFRNKP